MFRHTFSIFTTLSQVLANLSGFGTLFELLAHTLFHTFSTFGTFSHTFSGFSTLFELLAHFLNF